MKHEFKAIPKEERKQETLEEAAERLFPTNTTNDALNYQHVVMKSNWIKGAEFGAKWQAERMYSEEEVEVLIKTTYEETMRAMVDWFINNKDKNQEEMESAIENYVYPRLAEKGIKFKNK
jgi:hypothetical protein